MRVLRAYRLKCMKHSADRVLGEAHIRAFSEGTINDKAELFPPGAFRAISDSESCGC
jgi:hypothetical protein